MKSLIITLILGGILFPGCTNKGPRDIIIGKWRITDVSSTGLGLSGSLKEATIEFTKDGTWSLTVASGPNQGGGYSFSDDFHTLITTEAKGETTQADIQELSKEQLILVYKKTGIKITAVPK